MSPVVGIIYVVLSRACIGQTSSCTVILFGKLLFLVSLLMSRSASVTTGCKGLAARTHLAVLDRDKHVFVRSYNTSPLFCNFHFKNRFVPQLYVHFLLHVLLRVTRRYRL